jgi:hypothetical protein
MSQPDQANGAGQDEPDWDPPSGRSGRTRPSLPRLHSRAWLPPRRWWPVTCFVAAIALAVTLILPSGRHQWALSVFRQPARYTALSFRYAWLLPAAGYDDQTFPLFFTITNQEAHTVTYTYDIEQFRPFEVLSTGVQTIRSGETSTVDTRVTPQCRGTFMCSVEVILPRHAAIYFDYTPKGPEPRHQ